MQHSASSISLANRCDRAWWHCYRDKLRPPEIPWLRAKRMKARGERLPAGAFSKALGTETHRLAEIYLTTAPKRVARKRLIDWNDLPGQCLAELVPHLPRAGSVPRRNVEARFSVKVNGVSFRGLIDVIVSSSGHAEVWDHKTTRDIRAYALLPDAVAQATNQPKRSLKNDLQACLYVLARATYARTTAPGGLARWNYTETQRIRRSLPVVQYIPTDHARRVGERAAEVARRVESFESIDDAKPNTVACHQYGGCWYRSEGHCRVPIKLGALMIHVENEEKESKAMKSLKLKDLNKATAKANAEEERKAKKSKPAPPPEDTDEEEDEDADDSEDEEEAPPPKAKRKTKPAPVEEDDSEEDEDEEPAPAPAKGKKPPASERERLTAATAAPDHILQFFTAAGRKGESKVVATAFAELAEHLSNNLPRNPERSQCLRFLLQASDCATRAIEGEA